jgi:hypothetical protein
MTNLSRALKDHLRRETDFGTVNSVVAFEPWMMRASNEAICLDSCARSEKIVVNTCKSVYELIVVQGDEGEVLVRGGRKFPEFRRVQFVGSTVGGSALKVNTIDVGWRMEFHLDHRIVVTSAVQALSRQGYASDPTERAAAWRA